MGFWIGMLAFSLFIPVVQMLAGRWMWKHAPKKINGIIGYRTRRSMKNEDTWRFAHECCGRLWWRIGLVMLIPTAVVMLPFYASDKDTIGTVGMIVCFVQIAMLIVPVIFTEIALKKAFNNDGTRK